MRKALGVLLMIGWSTLLMAAVLPEGRLAECPDSPNCVSTQTHDRTKLMAAWPHDGSVADARRRILAILADMPRAEVVQADEGYIRVEFCSRILRFVDDVEFLIDDSVVHFRSASRVGYHDMGVNRRRMEAIGVRFRAQPVKK